MVIWCPDGSVKNLFWKVRNRKQRKILRDRNQLNQKKRQQLKPQKNWQSPGMRCIKLIIRIFREIFCMIGRQMKFCIGTGLCNQIFSL